MVFASNQMRIALGWLNDGWVPNLMPDDDDVNDDDEHNIEGEGQSATNQDNHQESQSCTALSS